MKLSTWSAGVAGCLVIAGVWNAVAGDRPVEPSVRRESVRTALRIRAELPPVKLTEAERAAAAKAQAKPVAKAQAKPAGEKPADSPAKQAEKAPSPKDAEKSSPAAPTLSPQMTELRDRLRRTLGTCYQQAPSTRESTAYDVLLWCLAFGPNAEVAYQGGPNNRINAVGCLCWNTSCAGYVPLQFAGGRTVPRVGYGLQEQAGQFLAMLADCRVPLDYEVRVGDNHRTVGDLVEFEKASCRKAKNLSLVLAGLSYYLDPKATWKNDRQEDWSIGQLIDNELERDIAQSDADVTDRLLGLSAALAHLRRENVSQDGAFERAAKHVAECQDYALKIQNADGSWNPAFFTLRGQSNDAAGTLRASGRILEWLVVSLPEERLAEDALVKAVHFVSAALSAQGRYLNALSPRDFSSVAHAARALMVYDERYFQPREPKKPAEDPKATQAKKPAAAHSRR